jgi:hypothetical protein
VVSAAALSDVSVSVVVVEEPEPQALMRHVTMASASSNASSRVVRFIYILLSDEMTSLGPPPGHGDGSCFIIALSAIAGQCKEFAFT